MSSGNVTTDFATWTPPPLVDLTFGSDCNLTKDFLQSWFDLSNYEDVDDLPGSDGNTTFWIPQSLHSDVIERYFREALPQSLNEIARYGEILEWEHSLRGQFGEERKQWIDSVAGQDSDFWEDSPLPFESSYFRFVIDEPSRRCKKAVCELNFDHGRLGDVNGPGVFIFYIIQLAAGFLYSAITLVEAARWWSQSRNKRNRTAPGHTACNLGFFHPTGKRPIMRLLYDSVKASYSGFSDSAAVFALVLPAAILTHNFASGTPTVWTKDLLLQYWILLYSNLVCLWLVRLGACIRRLEDTRRNEDPTKRVRKPTILSKWLMYMSFTVGILTLVIMLIWFHANDGKRPYKFESFWDDVCDFQYSLPIRTLVIAASILAGYCFVRGFSMGAVASWLARRQRRGTGSPIPLIHGKRRRTFDVHFDKLRILADIRQNSPTYRTFADVLGIMDVLFLGIGAIVALYFYGSYRSELFDISNVGNFRDGWTLGQVLAISTLMPILIEFLHQLAQGWRADRPPRQAK